MKVGLLSVQVGLWAVVGILGGMGSTADALPAIAQEESANDEFLVLSDEFNAQLDDLGNEFPIARAEIPQLSELEQPAVTIEEWIVQIEASLVQIIGVRVEETEAGLQVILETAEGSLEVPETRSIGNALIADIPNATIAEEFSQAEPIEGIALVSVTSLPGDRVRIAITGTDAPPVAEVRSDGQGLVLAVTLGDADTVTADDAIQVVVTGEQEEGYYMPESSVGTRTDTPLRDIPASIQVIPRQVLEDQRINQVREAVTNVSGVTPGAVGSQANAGGNFIIRGFQTDRDNLFVNGFRRYNFLNRDLEVANIEQIEILKGPASVLYGQGEPGGILNITTEQPLSFSLYEIEGTIGSFDFYRPTIDITGPLTANDNVRYRLNTAYQNSGSFVDFIDTEQLFIAPVLSFDLGENTTVTLEGEYLNTSRINYLGLPAVGSAIPNEFGQVPRSRNINDPDLELDREFFALGYRLQHNFSEDWSIRNGFRAELDYFDESFSFVTGLETNNRTVNRGARFDERRIENYSLQTDVVGNVQTGSIQHDLLFGVEIAWLNSDDRLFNPDSALPSIDLFDPDYNQPSIQTGEILLDQTERQILTGIYAQDLISIGEDLKILLGGRFDIAEASRDAPLFFDGTAISNDQESNAFSPRIGIVYQPVEPVSLYASFSRSFQPSRANSINADGSPFEPTTGEAFEVGVRTEFLDGRLAATLAAYQITKQNIVVSDPDRPGFSLQVGEQRSRGIELDIAGEILPGWNIIASYTHIDAEITEDTRPEILGNQPSNVARNSASLWTTYEIQSGNLQGLGFGAGLLFAGDRQGDLDNTFTLPSYVRADAAVYYRRDRWQAALNFKNLFDTYYFESANGRNGVFPGAPFTVLGTVSVQF
jgi:iron complex outermembrane recepter protein